MPPADPSSPSLSKRQRIDSLHDAVAPIHDGAFVEDQDAAESGGDDDDDEDKPKSDKKAGRRKIKIEFIQDKSRRHITFSKRKAGIMKKAYELSTLTGTQVLLLVVSETGLVYTFTTAKLQPLVTQPEGKNLIQACLNAPHGALPSSMPVGTPIGRSGPMSMPAHHAGGPANVPGGLSIAGVPTNKDDAEQDDAEPEDAQPTTERGSRKRRRASSSAGGAASPASRANTLPTAPVQQGPPSTQQPSTSPNARPGAIPPLQGQPPALSIPSGQPLPLDPHSPRQGQAQPTSPNYTHGNPYPPQGDPNMYSAPPHQQQHGGYPPAPPYGFSHEGGPGQQNAGLAAAHPGPWGPPPQVQQGSHYGRR
ncbi:SRF-TF-domain-containing protein [Amylocystis lapponica]|nr:SRF-TF-domain-containing protein [Amylocystis lapponica]